MLGYAVDEPGKTYVLENQTEIISARAKRRPLNSTEGEEEWWHPFTFFNFSYYFIPYFYLNKNYFT